MRENPLFYLFAKTWQYSAGNRKNVVWYWIMFICAELVDTIFDPLIAAKMIETVTVQGINATSMKVLYFWLQMYFLSFVVSWLFHGPARCIERNNAFKVRTNYSKHLLKGVITLPLEWHVGHHTGDTIDKVSKGTSALFDFSEVSFIPIRSGIQLIGCYMALVYFIHSDAFIVLGMLLVSGWITMRFDRILLEQYKELNANENRVSESVIDTISNISTIIVLRVEKLVFDAIVHKIEKLYGLFKRNQRLNEFKWFMTSMCCTLMTVLVIGSYAWKHWGAAPGTLVASFFLLISYLNQISQLFFRFTEMYGTVVRRKSLVLNSEELSRDFRNENFANHVLPKNWQRLDVSGLSFSYDEDGEVLHLDDVSFSVNRGERIAFVGETGSGKTTLLKIIGGLHHPRELNLSVDGQVIPTGFKGIKNAITLVQQNPEIFAWTILENITMRAEHALDFVLRFTDMACFTRVAQGLPKGFESSMQEKGVNLSGGQKQRLALSRGLLACHDKDIVLLDEPTSSLDAATEIAVYRNIFEGFSGKTIISTIHQLHLLPLFDRICVFDGGKIIASGTLQELLMCCPKFLTLWQASQHTAKN